MNLERKMRRNRDQRRSLKGGDPERYPGMITIPPLTPEQIAEFEAYLRRPHPRGVLVVEPGDLEPDWPVSTDGPHKISDTRRWLARKLMDSKLTDAEAFSIVAFHPSIAEVKA